MVTYLECMQEKYVPSREVVLSNDPLKGCFLSCLVDSSGNVIMSYRGSQSFGVQAREIGAIIAETDFDTASAEILYLREEDQGKLAISGEKYQRLVEEFKDALERISGVAVRLREYRHHSGFRLTAERELVVG